MKMTNELFDMEGKELREGFYFNSNRFEIRYAPSQFVGELQTLTNPQNNWQYQEIQRYWKRINDPEVFIKKIKLGLQFMEEKISGLEKSASESQQTKVSSDYTPLCQED